jgi:hypothetical protein
MRPALPRVTASQLLRTMFVLTSNASVAIPTAMPDSRMIGTEKTVASAAAAKPPTTSASGVESSAPDSQPGSPVNSATLSAAGSVVSDVA